MRRITMIACLVALAACAGSGRPHGETVSVQYDPDSFQMESLQRVAEAQCRAKGYPRAEPLENEANTEAVRWSYLTFGCFAS